MTSQPSMFEMQRAKAEQRKQPRDTPTPELRPSDSTNLAGQDTGREHLSHTMLGALLACPQRYAYRYLERLESISQRPGLSLGRAFHHAIEVQDPQAGARYLREHAPTPSSQDDEEKLQVNEATVMCAARYYLDRWPADRQQTHELDYRVRLRSPWTGAFSKTFDLVGIADGVIDRGDWLELVEAKLLGQLTETGVRKLVLDRQVTLACYGLYRATGKPVRRVSYRMVRKPTIRPRKGESTSEFVERLTADYLNPERREFYGHEEQLFRTTDDLLRVEMEMWQWSSQIREQKRLQLHPRNTASCLEWGSCEFLNLCIGDEDARALYRVRPTLEEREAAAA